MCTALLKVQTIFRLLSDYFQTRGPAHLPRPSHPLHRPSSLALPSPYSSIILVFLLLLLIIHLLILLHFILLLILLLMLFEPIRWPS